MLFFLNFTYLLVNDYMILRKMTANFYSTVYHKYLHFLKIPESCLLIVIGVVVGAVVQNCNVAFPTLTPDLFFNILLPPLILDASYAIYDRQFLHNLPSILIYAVIGTFFNIFAVGYGLYGINWLGAMGPLGHQTENNLKLDEMNKVQVMKEYI